MNVRSMGKRRVVFGVAVSGLLMLAAYTLVMSAFNSAESASTGLPHSFKNGEIADANQVNANFDALLLAIQGLQGSVATMGEQFTALENKVDTLGGESTALGTRLAAVEGQVDSLEADLPAVDGRVSKIEEKAATAKGQRVVFAEAETSLILTKSWQSILPISITVPSSGTIHVHANASIRLGAGACNPALLGIASGDDDPPQHIVARVEHCDPDTGANIPATAQLVVERVPAGTYTLHLVGMRVLDSGGTIEVSRPQMSVTFLPDLGE